QSGAIIDGEGMAAVGGAPFAFGLPTGSWNANFANNGSVTSTSPDINGVDVLGLGVELDVIGLDDVAVRIGNATYTGAGNVDGGNHGINLEGRDATATVTGGEINGGSGDGINANAFGLPSLN